MPEIPNVAASAVIEETWGDAVADAINDHTHSGGVGAGTVAVDHANLANVTATQHHAAPAAGPDANVTVDAAGAAGTASTFARSGHGHQVATTDAPSGANVTVDAAPSAAATGAIARAAHGHRLNTSSSTPAAATAAGSAGTSTAAPSRGDHAHPSAVPDVQMFTSGSGNWSKPSGARYVEVEVIGGGGGGGGVAATAAGERSCSGGGGGGGYARKNFAASALGSTVAYAIGAAGAAGTAGNNAGSTGGTSSFGTVSATGGAGGNGDSPSAVGGYSDGGVGGTGSGGDLNTQGSGGGQGQRISTGGLFSGTGGAAAAYSGTRQGVYAAAVGVAGCTYGGGGSGAFNTPSLSAKAGGAGAAGVVIVRTYF